MATKKDLVEAYSFSRRRLVTAFVSGAPGGREVEPSRPGRTIVGGIALAVLLVAGALVLGILKSPTTIDWDSPGLISEKESGADYILLETDDGGTELRPLANITSAMLILGPDLEATEVPRDKFERERGAPIGILGAPATPPEAASLIQSGWSACTGMVGAPEPTGIKIDLSEESAATPVTDTSFVVRTKEGRVYLIAESEVGAGARGERAYAYLVPDGPSQDGILQEVAAQSGTAAATVPETFVELFPAGSPLSLASFGLARSDLGKQWPGRSSVPGAEKAKIGDLLRVGEDSIYLVRPDDVVRLDPFSQAVYSSLTVPAGTRSERPITQAPPGALPNFADQAGVQWPITTTGAQPRGQLCALLDTPGGTPGVRLATTTDGSDASSEDVEFDSVDITVDPGHGAFVQSGDWDDQGPTQPILIDDRGYENPVGPGSEAENLGYADVDPIIVPQQWIARFRTGVQLTLDAARCPPTSTPEKSSCV